MFNGEFSPGISTPIPGFSSVGSITGDAMKPDPNRKPKIVVTSHDCLLDSRIVDSPLVVVVNYQHTKRRIYIIYIVYLVIMEM